MTTQERMKYVERALVCKRYQSQPTVGPNGMPDIIVDVKAIDVDEYCDASSTADVATKLELQCNHASQQPVHAPIISSPQCAICLEPFVDGDMIFESSSINFACKHEFHKNCIHQWCMIQTTCPCCRREVLFINNDDDNIINHETGDENQTMPSNSFRSAS